jgi:type IV fimbrial biogenesis protein FimT
MEHGFGTSVAPGVPGASAGFTLVELMMTLLLASILLAISVPMMRESVANNRLAAQTNDLITAMTLARSQAITLNQQVIFCRTASDESVANPVCATDSGNWEYWLVRTSDGSIVRRGTRLSNSVVVTTSLAADQVVFASDGLARNNDVLVAGGPHITVCVSNITTNNRRQVTIGAGSRLSTAKDSGACP